MAHLVTEVHVKSVMRWLELMKVRAGKRHGQNIGLTFALFQRPTQCTIHYYRGQPDPALPLQTSLERFCYERGVEWWDEEKITLLEESMRVSFQKLSSEFFRPDEPLPITDEEWEMKMRHYGLPSRMLDVSLNYLTALYFACWQGLGDFAVWEFRRDMFKEFAPKRTNTSATFVSPTRHFDARITAQEGVFIRQNSVGRSFSEALAEALNIESMVYLRKGRDLQDETQYEDIAFEESVIIKWIFASSLRESARNYLIDNDHFGKRLFPDLDGAVETIMAKLI